MSVWTLHLLNSRNALTPILSEIRAAARASVDKAGAHLDLPRFDLVVKPAFAALPGGGLSGETPAPGLIEVTLAPDRFAADQLDRVLVRQLHHLLRWDGPGYGRSLGDALVSEGLAGHFVLQVLGGAPDPRDSTGQTPGLARQAINAWGRLDYDPERWFRGKGDLRKGAGYGLGYRIVADHLSHNPALSLTDLSSERSETFRPTLRRLAGAEAADDAPETEAADPAGDA